MKFCFWGNNIVNALNGKTSGGGELQIALLSKALAKAGHDVVIIDPYSIKSFTTDEGIKLVNVPNWNKGWRGIRLFWYRIPELYKLFKEQNADYYYGRMRTYLHIIPYLAARKIKKKFILALASDIDVLSLWGKYKYEYKSSFNFFRYAGVFLPGDIVFKYLLRKADYVILQHAGQDAMSTAVNGKKIIFPNIIDKNNLPEEKNQVKDYFIYVGSLTMLKGADKLYQLVNSIDKSSLVMIVGQPSDNKSATIFEQLKRITNALIKGRLPHSDTLQLVANSKALINTSNYEGFPNVFLEAWAMGVPVVSLKVNPGNVINKYGLGICCDGDLERMKECINQDIPARFDKGKLISYINEFHDFNTAGDRFVNCLKTAQ